MGEMEFLKTAEEAARKAGEVLEDWGSRFTVSEKSRSNLVTEADFASQEAIYQLISGRYPDHGYLGEEGLDQPRAGVPRSAGSSTRWTAPRTMCTAFRITGSPSPWKPRAS